MPSSLTSLPTDAHGLRLVCKAHPVPAGGGRGSVPLPTPGSWCQSRGAPESGDTTPDHSRSEAPLCVWPDCALADTCRQKAVRGRWKLLGLRHLSRAFNTRPPAFSTVRLLVRGRAAHVSLLPLDIVTMVRATCTLPLATTVSGHRNFPGAQVHVLQ